MIPYCILVIEDDDDRAFMEQLFVDYHRLMYHEIFKLVHNQWAAEDVMQSTLVRLIDKIPELRSKDRNHLVNYIITASKNQSRNYLRDSGRHSTSDLQEFMEYEDPDGRKPLWVKASNSASRACRPEPSVTQTFPSRSHWNV